MFPLEFRAEVNHEETRVMGLSYSEDPVIVSRFGLIPACDRQTVRRTEFTMANTALSIASYADAL